MPMQPLCDHSSPSLENLPPLISYCAKLAGSALNSTNKHRGSHKPVGGPGSHKFVGTTAASYLSLEHGQSLQTLLSPMLVTLLDMAAVHRMVTVT